MLKAADVFRDEGAVGDERQAAELSGQQIGQDRAAAAAFDHDRISVPDKRRSVFGDLFLLLVMTGQAA